MSFQILNSLSVKVFNKNSLIKLSIIVGILIFSCRV